jgi:hypothetical protein
MAYIFAISAIIAIKISLQFDNPSPSLQVLNGDDVNRVEHKKNV